MRVSLNMFLLKNVIIIVSLLMLIDFVFCAESGGEESDDKQKEDTADSSSKNVSDESQEKVTVSPEELAKLKKEIIENQEENAEKFGLPISPIPEKIDAYLKEKEEELGTELPEAIEKGFNNGDDFKNMAHFLSLYYEIESGTEDEEEVAEPKSPEEMKKLKEEAFKLTNELYERRKLPEVSQEEFDEVWKQIKESDGKKFPNKIEKCIVLLKAAKEKEEEEEQEEEEHTTSLKEVPESVTEETTTSASEEKEEISEGTFTVKSAKGKVCILAKFDSVITFTYSGKSNEQKVEVTIPSSANVKGKCGGPNKSPILHISWGNFVFSLFFNKTSEDNWAATLVELTYDTTEPLFDGAVDRGKFTAKSKTVTLFETPLGKSYFCPGHETVLLYRETQQVAAVQLKEVHLQPYDVEDEKFSPRHHCNQVVIGGPEEEPFVQDETIPLAVGCTLALITLLILVGFSVHRAYNAAKVDYNTME